MRLFEMEYLYNDEGFDSPHRHGNVVVYDEQDQALDHAINKGLMGYDDPSELNHVLDEAFGLGDDDIVFYLDREGEVKNDLLIAAKIQASMQVAVYDLVEV